MIQVPENLGDLAAADADDDPVGLHEVVDGRPFLEELRVAGDVAVAAGQLPQPGGDRRVGAYRRRALNHHDRVRRQTRRNLLDRRPQGPQIDRSIRGGRGAHGEEDQAGRRRGGGQVGREAEQSGFRVSPQQFGKPRLVDRRLPLAEQGDLAIVAIDARDLISSFRQARARHQADVAGADDRDLHDSIPCGLIQLGGRKSIVLFSCSPALLSIHAPARLAPPQFYPKSASNMLCGENLGIFEHRTKVGILDVTLFATCSAGGRFLAKGVVV